MPASLLAFKTREGKHEIRGFLISAQMVGASGFAQTSRVGLPYYNAIEPRILNSLLD